MNLTCSCCFVYGVTASCRESTKMPIFQDHTTQKTTKKIIVTRLKPCSKETRNDFVADSSKSRSRFLLWTIHILRTMCFYTLRASMCVPLWSQVIKFQFKIKWITSTNGQEKNTQFLALTHKRIVELCRLRNLQQEENPTQK